MTGRPAQIQLRYRGESHTLTTLSRLLSIGRATLWRWHRRGEISDTLIDMFLRERMELTKRRAMGISKQRVYARVCRHGWSREEATSTAPLRNGSSRKRQALRRAS